MSGASITMDLRDLDRLQARLDHIAGIGFHEVLDTIGAVVERQTRRRISSEKESPEGQSWQVWSDAYKETRHGGQSLLQGADDLLASITHTPPGSDQVEIGSNLAYAGIHQFGDTQPVHVPAHQRTITQAFGRKLSAPLRINVGAYQIKRDFPARPYLGLSSDNENEIRGVIADWVKELLK